MDSALLKRHLGEAEEHVALGEQHIARQRQLVSKLRRGGHDTAMAETFLAVLEAFQALHVGHRDRFKRQLAEAPTT